MTDSLALPPPTFCHPLGVPTFPVFYLSFHGCSFLFRFLFFRARNHRERASAQDTISVSKGDHRRHPSAISPPPAGTRRLLLLARFARNRAETSEAARRGSLEDSVARGCTATRTRVLLLCKHARFSPPSFRTRVETATFHGLCR